MRILKVFGHRPLLLHGPSFFRQSRPMEQTTAFPMPGVLSGLDNWTKTPTIFYRICHTRRNYLHEPFVGAKTFNSAHHDLVWLYRKHCSRFSMARAMNGIRTLRPQGKIPLTIADWGGQDAFRINLPVAFWCPIFIMRGGLSV